MSRSTACFRAATAAIVFTAAYAASSALAQTGGNTAVFRMPGNSHAGPLPQLSPHEAELKAALAADVAQLAVRIGERNTANYLKLVEAAVFIEKSLAEAGYLPQRQEYQVRGRTCWNIEATLPAAADSLRGGEIVVVGAHYDSVPGSPAANDNGSGVAALLSLARSLKGVRPARTLRLVFFTNEEQPYFQGEGMGSYVYARRCYERREKIAAMLSLETLGYYSDAPGSQRYPASLARYYPTTGNFVGFVGNTQSAALVARLTGSFRRHAAFPSEGGAVPGHLEGVGWSDHWAFWQFGYPAAMATDTAFFRYPYYHTARDTPDKVDFDRLARVVAGLEKVIGELASPGPDDEAADAAFVAQAGTGDTAAGEGPGVRQGLFRRRR